MPLSKEPARCYYCIQAEKQRLAEEQVIPIDEVEMLTVLENTVDKITSRCCLKCGWRFCSDHASPIDQSDCCNYCLPIEDVSEMKTPLISQDEYGTHVHKGHRLVPTGDGYKTLPKAICQMTDEELESFIGEKQRQIELVEKQRDYLRVAQSTARLEKGERIGVAERALRGIKLPPGILTPSNKGVKITGGAGGKTGMNGVKGVSPPAGLDIAAFLKFVASQKSVKTGKPPEGPKPNPPTTASSIKMPVGEVINPNDAKREEEIEALLQGDDNDIPF